MTHFFHRQQRSDGKFGARQALRLLAPGLFVGLGLVLTGCKTEPVQVEVGLDRGQHLYDTCSPCHGPDGGGQELLMAPAIAGMDQWYVEAQLEKFKSGVRGSHFDDMEGARMRPMARSLELEGDLESVAMYVAQLPKTNPEPTVEGDAAAGKASFATCTACHGADGKGNEATKGPSLVGQSDWYLAHQITKFKSGQRGANSEDVTGVQMAGMSNVLADEAAINNVVAYIQTLE